MAEAVIGLLVLEMTPEQLRQDFESKNVYMTAMSLDPIYEIIVTMLDYEGSQEIFDFNTLSDHQLNEMAQMLLDGEAAATAELMYDMFSEMGAPITPLVADCLYTGLSTDTGCFKFTNTTARTHLVAAKLMEAGANTVKLNSLLFESKSRSRIELERFALENLEYYFEGRCALICLTREQIEASGVEPSELEGITAIPRMIEGVEVGLTLRQQPSGSYKASIRTVVGVDASAIAAHLGGGGHKQAAGCEILGSTDNAKAALLSEVEKALCRES